MKQILAMPPPAISKGKHTLFQIVTSLVPAGAERLVVHLLEYM
jgi:hypothetical protein